MEVTFRNSRTCQPNVDLGPIKQVTNKFSSSGGVLSFMLLFFLASKFRPAKIQSCTIMKSEEAFLIAFFLIMYGLLMSQVSSVDTLKQGDRLNSTSYIVSGKKNFTLGFYSPRRTNNSYIAVWYTDRGDYPVWIGNREDPFPRNSSPILSISSTGKLIVTHDGRNDPLEIYAGESSNNVSATLLDSGNFVLKDISSSGSTSTILWQSFDFPTDTLIPGMKLGVNHRTGRNWTLTSWFGASNPASGPFTLEWDTSSDMLVVRRRGVAYWTSGKLKDYYGDDLGFKYKVKYYENWGPIPDPLNWNYNMTNITSEDEEYFAYSLFYDPIRTPEEQKFISGWRLTDTGDITETNNVRPFVQSTTSCYGYRTANTKGCELWEQPPCRNSHQTFLSKSGELIEGGLVVTPVSTDNTSLSLSDCREQCWNDCQCFAFQELEPGCIYWKGKKMKFVQSVDGSSGRKYVLDPIAPEEKKQKWVIVAVVIPIGLVFLGTAFFLSWKFKQGKKKEEELIELLTLEGYTETFELEHGASKGHDLRLFTYASILAATDNFSSKYKLGEGGFGPVYKGITPEGHNVAIKILSRNSGQGLLEFKTELVLISKLQHVNLVKLIGFSIHGDDKMIVYDYMPNKSLDFFLFDSSERGKLDWQQRFKIIESIAQGLLYLHKYSRLKIIHRDLKASNILLDEDMNPKISDFGLARIFKQNVSEANTNRRVGTYGYMAPEYAMQGIFSMKSDVYSFGVLVLEIVSGRKNNSFHHIEGPLNLVDYACDLWSKDSALELMDPTLRDDASCITDQLQRCIHIGLLCVENHAIDRPTIEDVISMLKSEMTDLPMPKNPSFITRSGVVELKKREPEIFSANDVSVSEVEGR